MGRKPCSGGASYGFGDKYCNSGVKLLLELTVPISKPEILISFHNHYFKIDALERQWRELGLTNQKSLRTKWLF
jgi:hypothetical protein